MSEDLHNNEIFKNMMDNITNHHKFEQSQKNLAFKKDPIVIVDPVVPPEFKPPRDMINLRKKMKRQEDKLQRITEFKKQLRQDTELVITENINIDDFKKPWMKLTNDQRSNRINNFIKKSDYNDVDKKKLRLLLIQAITNKLLEKNTIQYDEENAEITSIPCLSYNFGTNSYSLI